MNAITVEKDRISGPTAYRQPEMEPGRDAWELLKRAWMTKGPSLIALPVDAFTIAMGLGIRVLRDDELLPQVPGLLRKPAGFEDPEIILNAEDARERRRFTCAHALGHYSRNTVLRREGAWEFIEARDFFDARIGNSEEIYATEFAAELLMPRAVLRELGEGSSVVALAAMFGVTGDVMSFRLDNIGWRRP